MLRISLFQNRSAFGRDASAISSLVRPTVLVLSTSYFASIATPDYLLKSSRIGSENSRSSAV